MDKKRSVGRPPVKDKKVIVTFTALSSMVKKANKKGLRDRNLHLESALYEFAER